VGKLDKTRSAGYATSLKYGIIWTDMTQSPETPFNNTPELRARRNAELEILEAVDLNPPKAVFLGRGLVQATFDYFTSFVLKHDHPLLRGTITRQADVLRATDSGDTQKLGEYLKVEADYLSSNPTWMIGQSPELLKLPDKLRELAKAIGN